jgi:hypothetical protein
MKTTGQDLRDKMRGRPRDYALGGRAALAAQPRARTGQDTWIMNSEQQQMAHCGIQSREVVEIPLVVRLPAGDTSVTFNSPVNMCPNRLIVTGSEEFPDSAVSPAIVDIKFGNKPQIVGSDGLPLALFAPGSFQGLPFTMGCICAGLPVSIEIDDAQAGDLFFAFIGPTDN